MIDMDINFESFRESTSLIDKYNVNFGKKITPTSSTSKISENAPYYILFEVQSLLSSNNDWYPNEKLNHLAYRFSFWLNSCDRISSDVIVNMSDIPSKGLLYVLELVPEIKSQWIFLNVDILYGPFFVPIAHGNFKFSIRRRGSQEVEENDSLVDKKPTRFQRRLSRLLIIKNFKDNDDTCEIDAVEVDQNSKSDEPKRKRKLIESSLVNVNQKNTRINHVVILNYSYDILVNFKKSDWMPRESKLAAISLSKTAESTIIIPTFRGGLGAVVSTSDPTSWTMNRRFQIFPSALPKPMDCLLSDILVYRHRLAKRKHSHESILGISLENLLSSISHNFDCLHEVLQDRRRFTCTVEDLQLSPDLLEYYRNHRLAVVVNSFANQSASFLGGIIKLEGRWLADSKLICQDKEHDFSSEGFDIDGDSMKSFEFRVISLESASFGSKHYTSELFQQKKELQSMNEHIYSILDRSDHYDNPIIICHGTLTSQCLQVSVFDDDNYVPSSVPSTQRSLVRDDELIGGLYDVVLYINRKEHEAMSDSMFVVGKLTVRLKVTNDKVAPNTQTNSIPPTATESKMNNIMMNALFSKEPLPPLIHEESAETSLQQFYDGLNIEAVIPILSSFWSRSLSSLAGNNNLNDYSTLIEIPFDFLLDEKFMKRSVECHRFWRYDCNDLSHRIFSSMSSILIRLTDQSNYRNQIFVELLSNRLYMNGSATILWLYIQNWLMHSSSMKKLLNFTTSNDSSAVTSNIDVSSLDKAKLRTLGNSKDFFHDMTEDNLSEHDWNCVRCVAYCLLLLRRMEVQYNANGYSVNENTDRNNDLTLCGLAEDLVVNLLMYCHDSFQKVFDHVKSTLERHESELNLGIQQIFNEGITANNSSIPSPISSSLQRNEYKTKLRIDHEKKLLEEKILVLKTSLDYIDHLITSTIAPVNILVTIIDYIPMHCAKYYWLIFDLYIRFCDVFFLHMLTTVDLEEFSQPIDPSSNALNASSAISSRTKKEKEKQLNEKMEAREQVIRLIRVLVNSYHRLLFSTNDRRVNLLDITCLKTPSKWERKGYLNKDPLSVNKAASIINENLMKCLTEVSSLIKKRYRYFIFSTVEYDKYPVVVSQIIDEIDVLTHDLNAIVQSGYDVFYRECPIQSSNSYNRLSIDFKVLQFLSSQHYFLHGLLKVTEALMTINFGIIRLPHFEILTDNNFRSSESVNKPLRRHSQSKKVQNLMSNETKILDYVIRHSERGTEYSSVKKDFSDQYDNSSNVDDELLIISWTPLLHLVNSNDRFMTLLTCRDRSNDDPNFNEIKLTFEHVSNLGDDASYQLIILIQYYAESLNTSWQMIDIMLGYHRSNYHHLSAQKFMEIRESLLSMFYYDANHLTCMISSLSIIVQCDLYGFDHETVENYQSYRRRMQLQSIQSDPNYNPSLKNFSLLASSNVMNDASNLVDHHQKFQLSLDNYIGLQYHRIFYGDFQLADLSMPITSSNYTCAKCHEIDGNYISLWLSTRYALIACISTIIKTCVTTGLTDLQLQIPSTTSEYQDIFYKMNIFNQLLPQLTVSLKDLCDCSPLAKNRRDIVGLCLELNEDAEMIIRTLFDVSCYIPAFNKADFYESMMNIKPIYELVSPRPGLSPRRFFNDNSKPFLETKTQSADTRYGSVSTKVFEPIKISRVWSKTDLYRKMLDYYDLLTDCRYNLVISLIHLLQNLSSSIDSSPLQHERLFFKLTYRAILCSLPSESIIHYCPTLLAMFGNEYKFKKLILSRYNRQVYQSGSGQVVQALFAILELPTSLDSMPMVSIRERFFVMLLSIRLYVFGKIFMAFRKILADEGIDDLHEFASAVSLRNGNIDIMKSSSWTSQYRNLYSLRYDNLAIVTALHSFLRIITSTNDLTNHILDVKIILYELQSYTMSRSNPTGKGDIRLYLPYESTFEASGSIDTNELGTGYDYSSTRSSYLNIQENFLGNLNDATNIVGYEYIQLPYEYRRMLGVMTDPMEELGKCFVASQGLLDLYLIEYAKNLLITEDEEKQDAIDDLDMMSASGSVGSVIGNFTPEQKQYVHTLERENRLIRKIYHSMEDVGDWESAYLFMDRVKRKYVKELKDIEETFTQAAILNASMAAATPLTTMFTSPNRGKSTVQKNSLSSPSEAGMSNLSSPPAQSSRYQEMAYQTYLLRRYKTLRDELNHNMNRVQQRLYHDENLRVFPLYYALRFHSELPLFYSGKHICAESDRHQDIISHLELDDFLEATNLTFLGVNTMGSLSSYGQSIQRDPRIENITSRTPLEPYYDNSSSKAPKHVRFTDNKLSNSEPSVYLHRDNSPLQLSDLHMNESMGQATDVRDDGSRGLNDINSNSVEGRDTSMDGLGQGIWVILRYDPTAYIASARLYKRFIECQILSKKLNEFQFDYERILPPVPPPTYQGLLSKLHESFPHYRILSSHHHVEKDDCYVYSDKLDSLAGDEIDTGISLHDSVQIPTLQLFEAYPTALSDSEYANAAIMNKIKAPESTEKQTTTTDEKDDLGPNEDQERNNESADYSNPSSNVEKDKKAPQPLIDEGRGNPTDKMKPSDFWKKAFFAEDFYVFAFEDESREHFYRRFLDKDDIDAPIEATDDDLSCPRLIRYTLTLTWKPRSSSFETDKQTTSKGPNDLCQSLLFNDICDELPWMAPSSLAFVKKSKRVSIIQALSQLLYYYDRSTSSLCEAIDYILSLSAKEYQLQRQDDITNSNTIIVAAITQLGNMYAQPCGTCLGLYNADTMISAALEYRELVWQQKRREIRRLYYREVANFEAKNKSNSQQETVEEPVEPDLVVMEREYFDSCKHLQGLAAIKDELNNRVLEIFRKLRKFINSMKDFLYQETRKGASTTDSAKSVTSPLGKLTMKSFNDAEAKFESKAEIDTIDVVFEEIAVWKSLLQWLEASYCAANEGFAI